MSTTFTTVETGPRSALEESGIQILAPEIPGGETILTPAALSFVAMLNRRFGARRARLL
ncbi:MAG: hypothetical protein ABI968_13910, partial [Acidobacteriota bacterium]